MRETIVFQDSILYTFILKHSLTMSCNMSLHYTGTNSAKDTIQGFSFQTQTLPNVALKYAE